MKLGSFFIGSAAAVASHNNGTGGIAPGIYQAKFEILSYDSWKNIPKLFFILDILKFIKYLMTNGDASTSYTGADPHAVHGLVTQERIQFRRLLVLISVR